MKSKKIFYLSALLCLMLPFQNCSFTQSGYSSYKSNGSQNSEHQSAGNPNGNSMGGQPYDGKAYVLGGNCADGTVVTSRLVLKGENAAQGATLYRENCQSESPRDLSSIEVNIDPKNADVIKFENKIFIAEKPAIPLPGKVSWYYQLQGSLQSRPPSIYIIDMFDTSAASIQNLKNAGHTVICMISAGTVENWRPDASSFLPNEIGNKVNGTNNEKWLDTRSGHVRELMRARLDLAKSKGCHGINFDSVDGYQNSSGFSLNKTSQLEYNQYLAFAAHDRELILSLNNVPDLASDLAIPFDFAIAEQCFQYNECGKYSEFVKRQKPVLVAEYGAYSQAQCNQAEDMSLSLVYLNSDLDGSRHELCK